MRDRLQSGSTLGTILQAWLFFHGMKESRIRSPQRYWTGSRKWEALSRVISSTDQHRPVDGQSVLDKIYLCIIMCSSTDEHAGHHCLLECVSQAGVDNRLICSKQHQLQQCLMLWCFWCMKAEPTLKQAIVKKCFRPCSCVPVLCICGVCGPPFSAFAACTLGFHPVV